MVGIIAEMRERSKGGKTKYRRQKTGERIRKTEYRRQEKEA